MSKLIKFYCLAILLIASCANPLPPSGGPPDKTPPVIEAAEPLSGTLNFDKESVNIEFSKYMKNNTVQENIFISPSVKMKFDWSGKDLEIGFLEKLDTNTTYALTFGTDYTDYKGNKPKQAYTLIFSTGSKLDSGLIKGRLFADKMDGVYLFAYNISAMDPDTLDPRHTKAHYRSQPGSDGGFSFHALKNGDYRIFAIKDEAKNELYDEGSDAFGAPLADITLTDDTIPKIRLKLGPVIDKAGPMLFDVESKFDSYFIASLDETMDTASVSTRAFFISDSTGTDTIDILSAFLNLDDPKKIDIITNKSLDSSATWQLKIDSDSIIGLKDSFGNVIRDTACSVYFFAEPGKDTLAPKLLPMAIQDSSVNIDPNKRFEFAFNLPPDSASFVENVSFEKMSDSSKIRFEIFKKADNIFEIKAAESLLSEQYYKIELNLGELKFPAGRTMPDSILILRFSALDTRTYSGAGGELRNIPENDSSQYLIIFKSKDRSYSTAIDKDKKWKFDKLPPGEYSIEIVKDSDGNGNYSFGDAFPFIFGENFFQFSKKLTIKPRWEIEDVILELPE